MPLKSEVYDGYEELALECAANACCELWVDTDKERTARGNERVQVIDPSQYLVLYDSQFGDRRMICNNPVAQLIRQLEGCESI